MEPDGVTPSALEASGLSAGYGDIPVLNDVSLNVCEGEIVCILGPNGAGKSTVLKTVMGYVRPSEGSIRFYNQELAGLKVHEVVRTGVGYVAQGRIVFPDMTVADNLETGGYTLRPQLRKQRIAEVLEFFPRLAERSKKYAGRLSGGEQQMVALARALMTRPKVLLLDEPSLGLAPQVVDSVFDKLVELNQAWGVTMLLVEQNAVRALSIAHRGYVLELGRNRFEGISSDLLEDPAVRRLYLGVD